MARPRFSLIEAGHPQSSLSPHDQRIALSWSIATDVAILPDPKLGILRMGLPAEFGVALNAAIEQVRGDYVGWRLPGETWLPQALDAVARLFAAEPAVDVVYGDALLLEAGGRTGRTLRSPAFDRDMLTYAGNFLVPPAVFMRRSCLWRIGCADRSFRHLLDAEVFLRAAKSGAKFGLLRRPVAIVRLAADADQPAGFRDQCLREHRRIVAEYARKKVQHPSALRALGRWYRARRAVALALRGHHC